MIIVIDATNLRDGGGVTHLTQLLNLANPNTGDFSEIIVLGCKNTLSQFDDKPHIKKINEKVFEKNYLLRTLWLVFKFNKFLRDIKADLLFAPGGSFFTSFHPVVTMSRNSLPVELKEARRYRFSITYVRLLFLRYIQKRSFLKSDGFIFLTQYARENFIKQGWLNRKNTYSKISIIPHGVNRILADNARKKSYTMDFTIDNPFKILYVSIIDLYKHQDKVALAIEKLNKEGFFVEINFVGPYYKPAFLHFNNIVKKIPDSIKSMIKYHGKLDRYQQSVLYSQVDCFLFASSCENMPNILLEGMGSGLPIICSNSGPMPEILKYGGEYFDPESVDSICVAILKMYNSADLRADLSHKSYNLSKNYSWERCTNETFNFLAQFKK